MRANTSYLRRRQSGSFPGFEAAGHGARVFVTHLLQTFGSERGSAAATTVTNDQRVQIRDFFLDVQFNCAATQMRCIWDVFFVPFVFLSYIDNQRFAVLRFRCRLGRQNFGDLFLRAGDELFEAIHFVVLGRAIRVILDQEF